MMHDSNDSLCHYDIMRRHHYFFFDDDGSFASWSVVQESIVT